MDRQTDGQMDRPTENTIHRAAWSQLKIIEQSLIFFWNRGKNSRLFSIFWLKEG